MSSVRTWCEELLASTETKKDEGQGEVPTYLVRNPSLLFRSFPLVTLDSKNPPMILYRRRYVIGEKDKNFRSRVVEGHIPLKQVNVPCLSTRRISHKRVIVQGYLRSFQVRKGTFSFLTWETGVQVPEKGQRPTEKRCSHHFTPNSVTG